MNEPIWLTTEQAVFIHDVIVARIGGATGVRDRTLLESAFGRPINTYLYESGDTFECAAAYAQAIAHNHPFVDGNKRSAFTVAGLFLAENGYRLLPQQGKNHEDAMVDLAEKNLSIADLAEYYREHCTST